MTKANYNFGEKTKEYNAKLGKEVDVWQSPKYLEAKAKAIEIIEKGVNGKNVLTEADFWILMNATKSGEMAYTGLIISHNGCLKINDALRAEDQFKPACMSLDKDGYNGSLVYSYCNDEQGIFEVGEVSAKNCTNAYPYAMALKRCMDRVILKNSKLAYSGIYSDSEAEEFKNEPEAPKAKKTENKAPEKHDEVALTGAEIRQNLLDLCAENNIDVKKIATEYKLNNKSTAADFASAYYDLQMRVLKGEEV